MIELTTRIRAKFIDLFQSEPALFYAPGRINLIGEHTDYNDGFVLPAAIDKKVSFAIQLNSLKKFRYYSIDFDQAIEFDEIKKSSQSGDWSNYLNGILAQFKKTGIELPGIDCVFGGDIPIGAGLSSSAAIECGFAFGLNKLLKANLTTYELVKMAQKAEHEYAGVMCGIMDQYASMFGKKDQVFKLDCRSHHHQYFHLNMNDHIIVLIDTRVKHALASSEYNARRKECEEGVNLLQKIKPGISALRDVSIDLLKENESLINPIVYKRCTFVIQENERVNQACDFLQENKIIDFGNLMYESHEGLRNEYEVSCTELDFLVDLTKEMNEVLGSRMMGGGFGGCTINLVKKGGVSNFKSSVVKAYENRFAKKPYIYLADIIDGAGQIEN
jgi:galactokinase